MSKKVQCKSAVLFINLLKKNSAILRDQIKSELEKKDIDVTIFSFEGKPGEPPAGKWDIAFSLGGDGTVLYTARCLAPLGIPILPVNLGTLGFIAEVEKDGWLDVFSKWENGEVSISRRCMFNISVERRKEQNSKIVMENICLNDAVVSASGIAKLINLDVHIINNEQSMLDGIALGSFRCDGLIISTPTGSTAYSMAAGGPILEPEMEAVILNPICPFTLSNRPFVLPSRQILTITVTKEQRSKTHGSGVILTVDGQDTFDLECSDKVVIKQSKHQALLILEGKHTYYSALRNKLFWSPSLAGDINA